LLAGEDLDKWSTHLGLMVANCPLQDWMRYLQRIQYRTLGYFAMIAVTHLEVSLDLLEFFIGLMLLQSSNEVFRSKRDGHSDNSFRLVSQCSGSCRHHGATTGR
jgi:hypothetical protein